MQIPSNVFGLIEYKAHPFWQQKYCPSHDYDHTPRCCSCERMEVGFRFWIIGNSYLFANQMTMIIISFLFCWTSAKRHEIHYTRWRAETLPWVPRFSNNGHKWVPTSFPIYKRVLRRSEYENRTTNSFIACRETST